MVTPHHGIPADHGSTLGANAAQPDPTTPSPVGLRDTIHHLVANAGGRLRAAGVDSPRVDAELLMAHALTVTANGAKPAPSACHGCLEAAQLPGHLPDLHVPVSRSSLFLRRNEVVPASTAEYFTACVDRRVVREPLQYIMGQATFCGVTLSVGPGAFIPRPETELMVEWVWSTLRHQVVAALSAPAGSAPVVMVDLCSGPGTIALGLAAQVFDLARSMAMSRSMATSLSGATGVASRADAGRSGAAESPSTADSPATGAADGAFTPAAGSSATGAADGASTPAESSAPAGARVIIVGVEKSAEALAYAQRNVEVLRSSIATTVAEENLPANLLHAVAVEVIQGDVTDPTTVASVRTAVAALGYHAPSEHYADAVVSNPPYVPASALVSPEVRADPAQAVFGGVDGMSVIKPMVPQMLELAKPAALLAIEHDDATGAEVASVLTHAGATDVLNHQDLAGRDRFVTARA